jgi:hypothetical protein
VSHSKHIERYILALIIIVALVVLALSALLVQQYRRVRQAEHLAAHHSLLAALHAKGPITASDVALIQPWMTFDYVNHLFALPPSYLQTSLDIRDARYPRLTVAEEAEDVHAAVPSVLLQTQNYVRAYLTKSP